MATLSPSATLYVSNLNEKLSKAGIVYFDALIEALKRSLYLLFSQYGQVIDIVAMKTIKMRGQAFIVYKNLDSAKVAIKALQGLIFYDRALFSLTKSNALLIHEGRYMAVQHKDHEKSMKRAHSDEDSADDDGGYQAPAKKTAPPPPPMQSKLKKNIVIAAAKSNVLFIKNLPAGTSEDNLKDLVAQYSGFKAVRMVPDRTDIAFVEFPSEMAADVVKKALHGLRIKGSSNVLNVDFYSQ